MEEIIMKKNNIKYAPVTLAIIVSLMLASCTKGFEEMNKNPMSPTGSE